MSLIDEIKVKSLSDAQEILKSVGSEDIFEKAHKDGDIHPNGKWVWVSSAAGGKGDWRTLNGRAHKKHQDANGKKENNNKTNHPQGGTKSNQSAWKKLSENVAVELGKQIVRQNLQRKTAVKNWVSSVLKTAADEGVIEAKKSTKGKKKQSSKSENKSVKTSSKKSALDKLLDDDPEAYEAVSQSNDVKWLKLQLNSDDKIYTDAVRERISEIDKK